MKIVKNIFSSITLIAVASFATAGYYDDDNYTYAPVVDVQPIYENVRIPQNRRVCEDRRNNHRNQYRDNHHANHRSNTGGAILGGIIGGLVGNRFGKGSGRDAATAAGVIAGAAIGANTKRHRHHDRNTRRCYTQRNYYEEQRIVGYDVSYEYIGRTYHTRLQNHPGDRIRINVNVQVAEH